MAAMDSRLTSRKTKHEQRFIVQGTLTDIVEIEERMSEVLILYSQKQRARAESKIMSICDHLHQEWFNWVQAAKHCNTDRIEEDNNTEGCEKQQRLVERTPFPSFDGSQEGWA